MTQPTTTTETPAVQIADYGKLGVLIAVLVAATVLALAGVISGDFVGGVLLLELGYVTGNGVNAIRKKAPSAVLAPADAPNVLREIVREALELELEAQRRRSQLPAPSTHPEPLERLRERSRGSSGPVSGLERRATRPQRRFGGSPRTRNPGRAPRARPL